jgi:hypothetical protein
MTAALAANAHGDGKGGDTVTRRIPKELMVLLACGALLWDLVQADKHQRTCPQCAGRDYVRIALDVMHLARLA